jgi:chaperone required for assembly of F1-ATPase
MKRFYKSVTLEKEPGGYGVFLDGKPVKTPLRKILLLPYEGLAAKVAAEWDTQKETINIHDMRITQLSYTYADKAEDEKDGIIAELLPYIETELICYPVPHPADLQKKQQTLWQPLMQEFTAKTGITLKTVTEITGAANGADEMAAFEAVLRKEDGITLTAVQAAVPLLGSAVLGYALAKKWITPAAAHEAALVEELHQAENWGDDEEAAKKRAELLVNLEAITAFTAV